MKIIKHILPDLIFAISILIVFFFLDYHNILFYRPQAIHFMRQTDCLSFVQSYYNNGLIFFEPQVLSQNSIDGKAIGEFPILYYITASLYHVFGQHEFILRLLNILLVSFGFYYLFKLLMIVYSDLVYALGFTFLFFSSTILIYYTNNFLPDAGALGLTLMGWYFYYIYFIERDKTRSFVISVSLFTLASLIKVTYGLNLAAALLSLLIIEIIVNKAKKFKKLVPYILAFIVSITIISGWYIYVIRYNEANSVDSFLTTISPIWDLKKSHILNVWDYVSNYWYTKYYYESTLHVFGIIIISGFFFIKYGNRTMLLFSATTTLGGIIYAILFYSQFSAHDYYFIALVPAIIFLVTGSFSSIYFRFPSVMNNIFVKIVLFILVILSLNYAKEKITDRYNDVNDSLAKIGKQLNNSQDYIKSIGIENEAKVIVIHDLTPNGSLYFMNRRGWTFKDTSSIALEKLSNNIIIEANYMVITDSLYLESKRVEELAGDKIGNYNGAVFYTIKK